MKDDSVLTGDGSNSGGNHNTWVLISFFHYEIIKSGFLFDGKVCTQLPSILQIYFLSFKPPLTVLGRVGRARAVLAYRVNAPSFAQ